MNLGLLVLRLTVGLLFMGHGAQKLWGLFGGHGIAGTGAFFEALGLRPGRTHATLGGIAEFAGGLLLVLGLLTPLAAALGALAASAAGALVTITAARFINPTSERSHYGSPRTTH